MRALMKAGIPKPSATSRTSAQARDLILDAVQAFAVHH